MKTQRLVLSLIQPADLSLVFETMNSQKTAEIISFLHWPMTLNQAKNWCEKAQRGFQAQSDFLFLARHAQAGAAVGCICLLKKEEGVLEVGYWVTESWQGQGYATEMLKAMIHLAFEKLGASKLLATAALHNPTSFKVLENQGFKIIGQKELPTVKGTMLLCHLLQLEPSA